MRKKVGIVTLNGYYNYGNRLQNVALTMFLKDLGYDVETIKVTRNKNRMKSISKKIFRNPLKNIDILVNSYIPKLINEKNNKKYQDIENLRLQTFREFTNEFIVEKTIDYKDVNDQFSKIDFFISGSDQVWNPHEGTDRLEINFLQFVPYEKRGSYAGSFGVKNIPENQVEFYRNMINSMKYLSTREDEGAQIIKKITNKESLTHIDPTLLIDVKKWKKISKPAENRPRNKPYILTYFLGTEEDIKEGLDLAIKTAEENNWTIINLGDRNDQETYATNPAHFLDYIENCSIFFTNSFHGVVFSILYKKPFIAFKRGNMNSRINTILQKFKLEDRKNSNIDFGKDIYNIDFSHCEEIIETEREKSKLYIKNMIE